MAYITFDEFYDIEQYNDFLNAAKNNGVKYSEWINIRTPYNWYLKLDESDLPKFVDYEVATDNHEKYMIKKILPKNPQDEYKLHRRDSDSPTDFARFVVNDVWEYISKKKNLVVFKNRAREELMKISKSPELKDTKIFLLGKYRGWDIAITDNKFIEGHISDTQVLYTEFDSERLRKKPWEVEGYINYYILRTDKIDRKFYDTSYVMNGRYYAVKVSSKYNDVV